METSLTWLGRLVNAPSGPDWKRLVDGYGPLLTGWLARGGVPASDRDDLVQEVLVAVVVRVDQFEHRGCGAFRAWLRGILANVLRTYLRGRPAVVPGFDPDHLAAEDSVLGRQWDREHDEYHAARAIRAVESEFAPAVWAAFRRYVLDGEPPKAVAAELGVTENVVLLAKSRVLKRLRLELSGLVG